MDIQIQKSIEEEFNRCRFSSEPGTKAPFIEGARFALSLTAPKWIEIKEGGQMPEDKQEILVYINYGGKHTLFIVAEYAKGRFMNRWDNSEILGVTHWQPLPPPPQQ